MVIKVNSITATFVQRAAVYIPVVGGFLLPKYR
nr:MAG TPA: hypothetical protein [Caudoviricetes sp.]